MQSRALFAVSVLALVVGGCSSTASNRRSDKATTSTTPAFVPSTASGVRAQTVEVVPSSGLKDKQVVRVVGRGFTPGQRGIGVVQCADMGSSTNPDDCFIGGIKIADSDGTGTVDVQFEVTKGPFGAKGIRCDARQACLISVTQLTLTPSEFASAPIEFG